MSVCASIALAVLWTVGFVGTPAAQAVVGRDWTARNPLPLGEDIFAVAGNSQPTNAAPLIVAVGAHGLILTSTDGTSWTQRTSNVTTDLNDVLWVNEGDSAKRRYIAVGSASTVLYSADGITWTKKNTTNTALAGTDNLLGLTYTGTRVIAVGGSATTGAVFTWDGVPASNWVKGTAGVPDALTGVVSVSSGTTIIAITAKNILSGIINAGTGALTFTKKAPTSGVVLATDSPASISVVPVGAAFLLCTKTIAGGTCKVWRSTNGTDWSLRTLTGLASSVLYLRNTGVDIVASGTGGDFWTSPDGTAWTQRATGQTQTFFGAARAATSPNPTYIAGGEGGRLFTSVPAVAPTWTSRYSTGSTANLEGVATNGLAFVSVGNGVTLTSPNGTTWTENTQTGKDMRSIARTASQFVAVGKGAWTSPDGITLTETLAPVATEEFNRVLFAGGQVVAVGFDSTPGTLRSLIYTSPNGIAWTKVNAPKLPATATTPLNGVAATTSGGLLVAVGNSTGTAGLVLTSPDFGITWTKRSVVLVAGEHLTDIAFGNNLFVAVTNKGGIWTSPNGTTWTKRRASSPAGFNRVMVAGNQILALGDAGRYAWSFGGVAWTDGDLSTSQNMADAVFNGTTAVAVGETGAILSSSGGQPPRPTVSFALATDTKQEDAGVVNVAVTLTPAATVPVTALFTLGGSATNVADYTVVATPVAFAAGEITKNIVVTLKKDVIDEINETLTLSLGAPSGDAVLGANKVHTLTLTDLFPTFTAQPAHQLVVAGTTVAHNATVMGAPSMAGTWKKNGGAAAGLVATTSGNFPAPVIFTGTIANVNLTHAGAYTLNVVSPTGTKLSDIAQLGVVENVPANLAALADTTVTLTAKAAGNGLTYQWLLGGQELHNSTDLRIAGTNTNKLVIKSADSSDTGVYACRVTQTTAAGQLTQNAATTNVFVQTSVPLVTSASLPSTTIGEVYNFTPTSSEYATGWTISQLPDGLVANPATGQITGKAKETGDFSVSLTASNTLGVGPSVLLNLHVNPLPANAIGTFYALIDRHPQTNLNLGAYLELTVAATGVVDGKLTQGSVTTNFIGGITYTAAGPTVTGSIPLAPVTPAAPAGLPSLPAVTLNFTINPTANTFTGSVSAGANTTNFTGTPKNKWVSSPVPTNKQGLYNFAIDNGVPSSTPTVSLENQRKRPLGFGFGKFTVPANGQISVVVVTADGNASTRSSVMTATQQITIYAGNFNTLSSLHGLLDLTVSGSLVFTNTDVVGNPTTPEVKVSGDLTWSRGAEPDQNTAVGIPRERIYRSGFKNAANDAIEPLVHATLGGHYFPQPTATAGPPASSGILMNAPTGGSANAHLEFLYGGLAELTSRTSQNNPDADLQLDAPAVVTANGNGAITQSPTITFATGEFNGTFTIVDANPLGAGSVTRSGVVYRGIVIREFITSDTAIRHRGYGFFLLPELPASGMGPNNTPSDPATNSPILSGKVTFRP